MISVDDVRAMTNCSATQIMIKKNEDRKTYNAQKMHKSSALYFGFVLCPRTETPIKILNLVHGHGTKTSRHVFTASEVLFNDSWRSRTGPENRKYPHSSLNTTTLAVNTWLSAFLPCPSTWKSANYIQEWKC